MLPPPRAGGTAGGGGGGKAARFHQPVPPVAGTLRFTVRKQTLLFVVGGLLLVLCLWSWVALLHSTATDSSDGSTLWPQVGHSNGGSNGVAATEREALEEAREDRALRSATDGMNPVALRLAIAEAQADGHDSAALRTAKFVLQHLLDEQQTTAPQIPSSGTPATPEVPVVPATPEPSGAPLAPAVPVAPAQPTPVAELPPPPADSLVAISPALVRPMLNEGTPHEFDWWKSPPQSLAGLLPPLEHAVVAEPVPGESAERAQQCFDAIVALADARFKPERFPIGVVAYNRPELLRESLASLLAVPGVAASRVTVYQDGTDAAVRLAAVNAGVAVKQHLDNQNAEGQEGAMQIARHYKWVFQNLFAANPGAEYAIVVEDDMLFAPDFLSFFVQLAPMYERDASVYCISSWNDNGQEGMALDPRVVMRTDFFIGLGWMISRRLFDELLPGWPITHWDHWLRSPAQRKGRQCLYPEVSRNYNIGKRGTHSDDNLYAKYFERIVLNKQPAVWMGDISRLHFATYEANLVSTLGSAVQLPSPAALVQYRYTDVVLFLTLPHREDARWERVYAPYFGLFHSQPNIRGIFQEGVLRTRWQTNYLYLVLSFARKFSALRRPETPLLDAPAFQPSLDQLTLVRALSLEDATAAGLPIGETCEQACRRASTNKKRPELSCSAGGLQTINNCDVMQKHFTCASCSFNTGVDQPAWVHNKQNENFGACLINSREPTCDGAHKDTVRLCACISRP